MRSGSPLARYRAEAAHALSRLQHYRASGDQRRAGDWHRTWSLAAEAVDAEGLQKGGGAAVLRRGVPSQLRPLPPEPVPAPPASPAAISVESPVAAISPSPAASAPLPVPEPAARVAMERHDRLERALRAGGPNPFPDELEEGEWQYHLTAFRMDGPLECEILQQAEAAVEALVEQHPDLLLAEEAEERPGGVLAPAERSVLPECLRIYRESLADLSENELRADLDRCLELDRSETAAWIAAELRQRERNMAPDLQFLSANTPVDRSGGSQNRKSVNTLAREAGVTLPLPEGERAEPSGPAVAVCATKIAEPRASALKPTPPRRRAAVYSTTAPAPATSGGTPKRPEPAAGESAAPTAPPAYTTAPAWIDAAGRTRTWSLLDPAGTKLAEITTRRDAEKLAALLTRVLGRPATPSP